MKKPLKYALINSLGTSLYVVFIASFIYFIGRSFEGNDGALIIPIAMLMLFVFSAALTGSLVFGRPIMWYLEGKRKEALSLLFYTILILFLVTLLVFILVFLIFS